MTTFTFTILDTETGKVYMHADSYDYEQRLEGCDYGCAEPLEHALHCMLGQWGRGNFECDCNRGWFATGEDVVCGSKRFKVTQVVCNQNETVWLNGDPRDEA